MKSDLYKSIENALLKNKVLNRMRVKEMTDTEKALLSDCPICGYSFAFAWLEVDADGFCRVTCGGCEEYIEYQVDQVNAGGRISDDEAAAYGDSQIYPGKGD